MVEPFHKNKAEDLPVPDKAARERSEQLTAQIKQACDQQGGQMPFSEFMSRALYTPVLGYYSSGLQKFGQRGDFITAPEVSPLFALCLARQLVQVFEEFTVTGIRQPAVLEFGAGSGVLALELLLALEKFGVLPDKYYILELSADLQQRQQQLLQEKAGHLFERVIWLSALPEQPINAVVIANEVLDAMPVECFAVDKTGIQSLVIRHEAKGLSPVYVAAGESCQQQLSLIAQRSEFSFPEKYCSEYNPAVFSWLQALYDSLATAVVFLIDYGYHAREYYHPDRVNGTLMCYYQHRAHSNPLWYPGLQDITAFVDFTDVAYSAAEAGFSVSGYTTQAAFLLANGLAELHAEQVSDDVRTQVVLSQQIKTLTLPSEMGERFKVMALTRNYDGLLAGFELQDFRNRL